MKFDVFFISVFHLIALVKTLEGNVPFCWPALPWLQAPLAILMGHSFKLMAFVAHVERQLNKVILNSLCPKWLNHNLNKRNQLQLNCKNTKW